MNNQELPRLNTLNKKYSLESDKKENKILNVLNELNKKIDILTVKIDILMKHNNINNEIFLDSLIERKLKTRIVIQVYQDLQLEEI
jgi:hypothetical protein